LRCGRPRACAPPRAPRSTQPASARPPSAIADDEIRLAQLPPEARETLAAIRSGGPFAYPKDGTVFGNREKILPARQRGYYREYTVKTPGERSRGARRIVCGGQQARTPDACFFTDDHYGSFRRIVP
jgi:ribonuclease T1